MKLTLASTPKAFVGHIGLIQRNALASWLRLRPRPEVLLFGREEGTAEVCEEFDLRHVPDTSHTEFGTPHLSDILERAQGLASAPHVCYVNADILLLGDFAAAVGRVLEFREDFLAVGRRHELDVTSPIDFDDRDWEGKLRRRMGGEGWLAGLTAIDYFVFPRGFFREIPPFIAGRIGFDWWLIHDALRRGAPVIDLTSAAVVIHQRHAHGSVRPGHDEETRRNVALYQVPWTNLYDATHRLTRRGLRRTWLRRAVKPLWVLEDRHGVPIVRLASTLWRRAGRLARALVGAGPFRGSAPTDRSGASAA